MIEKWRAVLIGLSASLFLVGIQNPDRDITGFLVLFFLSLALAKFK